MADDSAPNVGTGGGGPSEMDIDNDENDMDIQPLPGDVSGNLGVLESEEEPTMQGTSDIPTESTGEHGFDEAQAQATSAGHGTSTPAGHDLSTINPIQATSAGHETSSPYPASAGATRGEVGGYGPIRANLTEALRRSVETLDLGAIRASRGAMGSVNETRNETLEVLMAQPVSNSEVQNHELAPQRKKKHIYIYIFRDEANKEEWNKLLRNSAIKVHRGSGQEVEEGSFTSKPENPTLPSLKNQVEMWVVY